MGCNHLMNLQPSYNSLQQRVEIVSRLCRPMYGSGRILYSKLNASTSRRYRSGFRILRAVEHCK